MSKSLFRISEHCKVGDLFPDLAWGSHLDSVWEHVCDRVLFCGRSTVWGHLQQFGLADLRGVVWDEATSRCEPYVRERLAVSHV